LSVLASGGGASVATESPRDAGAVVGTILGSVVFTGILWIGAVVQLP
jgi:hypothetical protein